MKHKLTKEEMIVILNFTCTLVYFMMGLNLLMFYINEKKSFAIVWLVCSILWGIKTYLDYQKYINNKK